MIEIIGTNPWIIATIITGSIGLAAIYRFLRKKNII